MSLSPRLAADLDWALSFGATKFQRSPFGAMLERQQASYNLPSSGNRGGHSLRNWRTTHGQPRVNGRFVAWKDAVGVDVVPEEPCVRDTLTGATEHNRQSDDFFAPATLMHVSAKRRMRDSYEPNFEELHRFGYVSSALYKIEQSKPLLASALIGYYGDRGSRWAHSRPGEGRLLAVFPLTSTGAKWVDAMRKRDVSGVFVGLRDDERIATEVMAQERAHDDLRGARIRRIENEARDLMRTAEREYERTVAR